jgi:hypothetical protein
MLLGGIQGFVIIVVTDLAGPLAVVAGDIIFVCDMGSDADNAVLAQAAYDRRKYVAPVFV